MKVFCPNFHQKIWRYLIAYSDFLLNLYFLIINEYKKETIYIVIIFAITILFTLYNIYILPCSERFSTQSPTRNIIFYYNSSFDNLIKLTENDLKKLTEYNPVNTDVFSIIDSSDKDTFSLNYKNGKWLKTNMFLDKRENTPEVLLEILFSQIDTQTMYYTIIFIYAGHGKTFYINPRKDTYISTEKLAIIFEKYIKFKLDLLVLDSCLMASFENLYNFRNSTRYIIASENFGTKPQEKEAMI